MNKAKEVLAYELTKEVHGGEQADLAQGQARAAFGGGNAELLTKEVENVATVVDAMVAAGVAKSKGEARRLIESGMAVSTAAITCGFENLSYFTRTFKKIFQQLPSDFLPK